MKTVVDRISAWTLAVVFLYAGIDKLTHYSGFVTVLETGVAVPPALAPVVAPPVIVAELAIGAGLLFARSRRIAAIAGSGLLAAFLVVLVANALYGPAEAPCGCSFTLTLGESKALHVAFDAVLIAIAGSLAMASDRSEGAASPAPGLTDRSTQP